MPPDQVSATSTTSTDSSHGTDQGGGDDLRTVIESTQRELAERTGKYESEITELRQKGEKSEQFLERLRDALTPEEQRRQAADPIAGEISEYEKQLDHYLQAAVEAERAGRPIPLTVNLAVQHFQSQIRAAKDNQKLQKELRDLKTKTDRANDPSAQIDSQAYAAMDSQVISALEQIYGPDGTNDEQKAAQFDAVTKQLGKEIKSLRAEDPAMWDKIRRSPAKIQKMVNHFVTQNMPPRARQILEQEKLRNTPLTVKELQDAFAQASSIQDPRERASVRAQIRQTILSQSFGRGRGYNAVGND